MRPIRAPRHRALILTAVIGVVSAGCLGVVLAETAGAASVPAQSGHAQNPHIVSLRSVSDSPTAAASTGAGAPEPAGRPSAAVSALGASPSGRSQQPLQLTATQLPALYAEKWQPVDTPSTRNVAGHDIGEDECAKVDGAETWTQQAFSGGDGQNVAIQDTFVFAGAAAAQSAYRNVVDGMDTCRQTTRALQSANRLPADATVTETASLPDAAAWRRDWTGVMGMSAAGPQINHLYAALDGTRLIVLQFTEFPGQAAGYDVSADPSVLSMLEAELAG